MSQVAGKTDPSIDGWSEIQDLLQQTQQENTAMRQQLEILRLENRVLKDKLKVLCDTESNDSRTDNEKAMLLGLDSSDATNDRTASIEESLEESAREQSYIIADANGDQILPGFPSSSSEGSVIPDEPSNVSDGNWDDMLSSEGEGSVACLQDRIHQMEENHYTVNEELQATLQELTDLQENVNELTSDNEKLNEEKKSVIEVLYKQMEKVKKLNAVAEQLKTMLEEHSLEFDEEEFEESFNKTKSSEGLEMDSQEDLEEITDDEDERRKLSEILDEHRKETHTEIGQLKDNLHEMQDLLHTHYEEKECIYEQLMLVKSQLANREVELQRVKGQLNETKAKMADILQYQDPEGSLDLAALLEKSSKGKEELEARIVQLQEEVKEGQAYAEKLQEDVKHMEEDVEGGQEQMKQDMQMVKDMLDELNGEKQELETEVINLKETIMEMEEACAGHEQDKQQHLTTIADLNNAVQTLRKEKQGMHKELTDLRRTSTADSEEWMQFQKDLQKAVVIANDYRNEAQEEVDTLIKEREDLQDRLKSLDAEVDRLRKLERLNTASSPPMASAGRTALGSSETEIRQRMQAYMKTNDKTGNRKGTVWTAQQQQQPLSVKNLIKTIESAAAQDAPKLPTNLELFNGECSSPPPRPMLERRNTTIAATKSYESKPQYTRRATQSVTSPTEPRKSITSTKLFNFDEMSSPTKDSRSKSHDVNHISPDTPPKTPTTRSEARQAISDALFLRSDFLGRKAGVTSPGSSSKDFADVAGGSDSLSNKSPVGASGGVIRRNTDMSESRKDPLTALVKIGGGGSKRNALLKWCQQKTQGYKGIDITNFSSSWNDGLAFCALMHNYLSDQIPFRELNSQDKRRNFTLAFKAAESLGIASILDIEDMVKMERPDWQSVMTYVTSIYKKVET